MIGTIFSVLAVLLFWLNPYPSDMNFSTGSIEIFMIGGSLLFLLVAFLGNMLAWSPLQKVEQNLTPYILEMFRKDRGIYLTNAYAVIFVLITFFTILIHDIRINEHPWVFYLWIVFFGIAIDAIRHFSKKIIDYLNPFEVVKMFTKKARRCIQEEQELDLCYWIDGLSEMALKGIMRHSTSVSHIALDEERQIVGLLLDASKSISHHDQDKQTKALGIPDKVSYIMFYLYQRLDVIFEIALKKNLEMSCTHIVTLVGKNSIDAAKYDISMASAPLRFLGKFAKRAQDAGLEETAMAGSCMLSEVAKTIINEVDITYYEIKDAFLSIINSLEMLAKDAFQRNKNINIALLMQPFLELRALFESGKAKEHQDAAVIILNINRVLGEFQALQMVMNTLPPMPIVGSPDVIEGTK